MSHINDLGLISFLGQFRVMLEAGYSSVQSLKMILDYTPDSPIRAYLETVVRDLESGQSLEKAFFGRKHPFPEALVRHITFPTREDHVMAESVKVLEDGLELKANQTVRLPGANQLSVITLVGLAVSLVVLVYVVPMFEAMFSGFGRSLPALTQAALDLSFSIRKYWYIWIGLAGGFIFLVHRLIVRPSFSSVGYHNAFALMLSRIKSGDRPDRAAEWVAESLTDRKLAGQFKALGQKTAGGEDLSAAFRLTPGFPPFVSDLIALGEAKGDLVSPFEDIVGEFSWRLQRKKEIIIPTWEAALGIGFLLFIAGLVIAMYLPLFSLALKMG